MLLQVRVAAEHLVGLLEVLVDKLGGIESEDDEQRAQLFPFCGFLLSHSLVDFVAVEGRLEGVLQVDDVAGRRKDVLGSGLEIHGTRLLIQIKILASFAIFHGRRLVHRLKGHLHAKVDRLLLVQAKQF